MRFAASRVSANGENSPLKAGRLAKILVLPGRYDSKRRDDRFYRIADFPGKHPR
jgi:hypothetical protein